ncbi:MAG: hypothetical protein RL681_587 [Candidatus Parcubacteria bacterium]|jgi:hypothetical protein
MRIFSLCTAEDFQLYVFVVIVGIIPSACLLLIPLFIWPYQTFGFITQVVSFFSGMSSVVGYVAFSVIPAIGVFIFFRINSYKTIWISAGGIKLENNQGDSIAITPEDIDAFVVYRILIGQTFGNVKEEVHYAGLYPLGIRTKGSKSEIHIFARGEVWNALKAEFPSVSIQKKLFINRFSIIIAMVSVLQAVDGIIWFIAVNL